jgi:FkbM family methyltransferase
MTLSSFAKQRVLARFYVLGSLAKGDISLNDTFHLLIPGRFRTNWDASHVKTSFKVFGKKFVVPLGNFGESLVVVDPGQYCLDLIKDGDTVVDAGANVGGFSVLTAHAYPKSKIYSFEPTPMTFAALNENTKEYPNVTRFNAGLGETVGTRKFVVSAIGTAGNHFFDGFEGRLLQSGDKEITVNLTTIDETMKGAKVDFIKIDAEGYEAQIIEGAKETIRKWRPILHLSAYHRDGDIEKLPAMLKSMVPEYQFVPFKNYGEDIICSVPSENLSSANVPPGTA